MNQIPAIINTSPPEPKASGPEITGEMIVENIIPSNNYGKDQFEITAKINAVDQFYSKKYWILQSMPGAKELQIGSTVPVSLRRRRLQQTREGIVKGGYNEEGRLLNHEWDWEIISLQHTEVSAPAPTSVATAPTPVNANNNTPNPIASTTPVSSTMSKDMVISRTAMLKSMIENHSKPVNTWDREDMGHATVIVAELVKIIYDEWK
jgi:hypothetical protein